MDGSLPDAGTDAGLTACQITPCTGVGEVCDQYGYCSCGPGYVFDNDASLCVLVTCPALTIPNGVVTPSGNRVAGDVVAYGCNTDFALSGGTTMRTCQDDGTWSGTSPTCVATGGSCFPNPCSTGICNPSGNTYTCDCTGTGFTGAGCDVPVLCTGLVNPSNGSVSPTSAMPDGVATYLCDTGYAVVGSSTSTCLIDGTWSDPAPTCEPVMCPTLTAPTNGSLTATTGTYNQSTSYSCDSGYAISGSGTRTCLADGTWSGTEPTCVVANDCTANPCQNGACTDAVPGPGYSCACDPGWSGANCDVPVSCGALTSPANGSVSTTTTTNGGVATYLCTGGYQLNGNGGSAMRTCQVDGSWSGVEPTCDPLSCTANAPANGSIDNAMPYVGAEVVYSCNAGYVRNGVLARLCQADLSLEGLAPTCDPVVCTASAPANGTVSAPSVTYTGAVSYACDSGYMLAAGDSTRSCQADGTLGGVEPMCVPVIGGCTANPCANGACTDVGASYTCACDAGWSGTNCDVPVDCGALADPTNGNVATTATTLGSVGTYVCNAGYSLTGASTRSCDTSGAWSGTAPTCDPIACTGAVAPTNGSIDSTTALYPTSITYSCDSGYVLSGNGGQTMRACQSDGSFSGTAPTCAPVDCGALTAPQDGSVAGATTFMSTSTYSCNGGFALIGASTTTCTANGTWSATPPTCQLILTPCMPDPCNGGTCTAGVGSMYTCSNCPTGYGGANCDVPVSCSGAVAPTNGSVSSTATTYNLTITYACDSGYNAVGGTTRTCQSDGTFSGSAPTCAPVSCTGAVAPTNGSVSASSTTYNMTVGYTCNSGYVLNGSSTRTCTAGGTFSGATPTCDPVDCGALMGPSNGSVSAPTTTFGATATYSCNSGYVLSGGSTRSCQASTTWSGAAPTCTLVMTGCSPNPCQNGGLCSPMGGSGFTCDCSAATGWVGTTCSTAVTCMGAAAPTNGAVSSSTATYNNTVAYSCNAGYSLVGSSTQLCQVNGTFAGAAPTCAAVSCGGASAPANGTVSATSTMFPNTITYACNMGYTLTGNGGSSTRACQADTTFSGTAPTCAAVTCSGAVAPTNGAVTATSATFGNAITYSCNAGYTLTGTAMATCQANATFSSMAPTCVPVSCPGLAAPTNGSVTVPSTTFGSLAMYSCDAGFSLVGTATTTCQANMTWSNAAPTCTAVPMPCTPNPCMNGGSCTPGVGNMYTCACAAGYSGTNCGTPVTCSGATAPTNGAVSAMSATFMNTVTYSCNSGYNLVGSGTRTCQAGGTFSGAAPTCAAVTCAGAIAPSNGTVSSASASYPNSITYTCNSGYTLTGSSMQMCTAGGTFSGSAPTCTPVSCGTPTIVNGTVSAPVTTFGATAMYSCNANYAIQGTATGTCQANGMWSTPPTCVYDCGALAAPTSGSVTSAPNNLLGGTATYTCNAGFSLTGGATRMCTATGWNGTAPTCTAAAQVYCDVVYHTGNTPATQYGTLHIYQNGLPLGAVLNATTAIGLNTLSPAYGNTPNYTTMMTPLTPATYPNGWVRLRYNANAAGTAPVAGPVSLIELFTPVDAQNLNLTANILGSNRGVRVDIAIDGAAGILQTTTVGCAGGAARCPVLVGGTPVIQRSCTPIATGMATGTSITWPSCSITDPGGTTGTPNAAQLTWTADMSVAQALPADPGCVRNFVAYGGVKCTAVINNILNMIDCSLAGALTSAATISVWDQKLPTVTLSSATYATATATIPEFIIPETGTNTYVGARIANMPVAYVECGTAAMLTCNEQ